MLEYNNNRPIFNFTLVQQEHCTPDTVLAEPTEYGIGVDGMQPGDKLCFITGLDSPIILRPAGTTNQYKVLGDAWTEGYNEGSEDYGGIIRFIKEIGAEPEYFDLI
jgi:hypothetical protein